MSETRETLSDKRKRALQEVASVLFLTGILAVLHHFRIPICPTKIFFGIPCPLCGSTRAMFELVQGHVLTALSYQPLMVPVTLYIGIGWGVNLLRLWSGREEVCLLPFSGRWARIFWSCFLVLLLANWIYVLRHGN